MAILTYQILDVGLTLEAPQGDFLSAFHQDYGRFEVPALKPGNGLRVHFEDGSLGTKPFLEVEGLRESLDGHPYPALFATQSLARILMERVENFTVLHAAVLASAQGVLALSGTSGAGKTTLTMALLERGWSYYSDDFCPVNHETGLVHPFPRSLWVRPALGEEATPKRRGKVMVPADGQGFPIGGPPLPLRWLVCLGEGNDPDDPGKTCLQVNLRQGRGGSLLEALRKMEGTGLQVATSGDYLRCTFRYPRAAGRTRKIKELLHQHRDAIWDVYSQPEGHPDFSKEPVLVAIPAHEAAFFLLQELKHDLGEGQRSRALLPGALLSHLIELLRGVDCYRLSSGPLDRRLALLQAAMNTVESP